MKHNCENIIFNQIKRLVPGACNDSTTKLILVTQNIFLLAIGQNTRFRNIKYNYNISSSNTRIISILAAAVIIIIVIIFVAITLSIIESTYIKIPYLDCTHELCSLSCSSHIFPPAKIKVL
jgi:hypothetical protein